MPDRRALPVLRRQHQQFIDPGRHPPRNLRAAGRRQAIRRTYCTCANDDRPYTRRAGRFRMPATPSLTTEYAGERHPKPLVLFSLSPRETGADHLVRVAEWQTR